MKRILPFRLPALAAILAVSAANVAVASLPTNLPQLEGLNWELWQPQYSRIEGNYLIFDIPEGVEGGAMAGAWVPYEKWHGGQDFAFSISCTGENIAEPEQRYLGFKCQMMWYDSEKGENRFPNTRWSPGGWTNRVFYTSAGLRGKETNGIQIQLGLQDTTGRVVFDLSTLRGGPVNPPYPHTITNQDKIVEYPESVRSDVRRRGFMLAARRPTDDDFRTMREWKANLVRYPIVRDWYGIDTNRDIGEFKAWFSGQLDIIEESVLPLARKYGLKVVVDFHVTPGGRPFSGGVNMFDEPEYAEAYLDCWRIAAGRLVGNDDVIYGYDLVNEPDQPTPMRYDYIELQEAAARAIREIDPVTPVIVESAEGCEPSAFAYLCPIDLDNVIYQFHMYEPHEFTHQRVVGEFAETKEPWPNADKGWNRELIREIVRPVFEFSRKHQAKIYVGEFSTVSWSEGAEEYLSDCIAVFEEFGWDWTYHAFRDWEGWSLEHEPVGNTPDGETNFVYTVENPRKAAVLDGFARPLAREHVIDVPTGERRALTGDECAAVVLSTLVKTGGGTLVAGDELRGFAGDIEIRDGVYEATTKLALGNAQGVTCAAGGTLLNRVGSPMDGSDCSYPAECICLSGIGYNELGALRNEAEACDFCRNVTLTDDARVTGSERLDFRATRFDMGGHTLTSAMEDGKVFHLVATDIVNEGHFYSLYGGLEFQGDVARGTPSSSVTISSGGTLGFYDAGWQNRSLVLDDGAWLTAEDYGVDYLWGAHDRNTWQGPVWLNGDVNAYLADEVPWTFWGKVSGSGGFTVTGGGWLGFYDASSDFTDGVNLTGVAHSDGTCSGGVAVRTTTALPRTGVLKLTDANLHVIAEGTALLPDTVMNGTVNAVVAEKAEICHLHGFPTLWAGELLVTGSWTLRAYDRSKPLKVADGATLAFADGVTITFGDGIRSLEADGPYAVLPLIRFVGGGSVVNMPDLAGSIDNCNWSVVASKGGNGYDLIHTRYGSAALEGDELYVHVEENEVRAMTEYELFAVEYAKRLVKIGPGTLTPKGTEIPESVEIVVREGRVAYAGEQPRGSGVQSVLVEGNGAIGMVDSSWLNRELSFNAGAWFFTGDCTNTYSWGYCDDNSWQGPVTLAGDTHGYLAPNTCWTFWGKVSGNGGFNVFGGGWLELQDWSNDFRCGVAVTGVLDGNGEPIGGLVVRTARAVPPDGAALALTNANLHIISEYGAELPELVCSGKVVITATNTDTIVSTPALVGVTRIACGEFCVSDVWTLSAKDIGRTLEISEGSALMFGDNARLIYSGPLLAAPQNRQDLRRTLLRVACDVRNLPRPVQPCDSDWRIMKARDGSGYDLVYDTGLKIRIR